VSCDARRDSTRQAFGNIAAMKPEFTAHNIVLDDGTQTKPESGQTLDRTPWFEATRRVFELAFPGDRSRVRVLDVGCLEGGYSVELARLGFDVTGLEVRESNRPAIELYRSMGFAPVAVRRNYYSQPSEDALVFRKDGLSEDGIQS